MKRVPSTTFGERAPVWNYLCLSSKLDWFIVKKSKNFKNLTPKAPFRTQNELKRVPGGPQRSSKFIPGNHQGLPMDPRGAKVLPQAPPGSPSGASGSTPGPSKTYVF